MSPCVSSLTTDATKLCYSVRACPNSLFSTTRHPIQDPVPKPRAVANPIGMVCATLTKPLYVSEALPQASEPLPNLERQARPPSHNLCPLHTSYSSRIPCPKH